ncbi:MAG: hypothetical protein BWY15_01991 [Firmicutes bacterium ADurb.Bin193]|nr:MAG: hypothetical protein BWY15_01991 [Firmicutes bacterium ADurb.Bin193]
MKKRLYRILTLCTVVVLMVGILSTVSVFAVDLRSETERLLKEYIHKFDNWSFAKSEGVSLGNESTYLSALAGVDVEYDPNLKAQAEYRPPVIVLGKVVSRGKIVFSEDVAGGQTSPTLSGTIWHELTHVIEGGNGDDDAADADNRDYQERHIEYMEQASRALDKLMLLEGSAKKGDNKDELKRRWEVFLSELAKAPKQPGPAAYPVDEARLIGWFGFKVIPKEILKHYATGVAGDGLKELAKEYGITSSTSGDLGKYTWEGQWDSNWGNMVLTQSGNTVTGTYTHDSGRINAVVSGNKLTGTWSEAPSYSPDNDAGDIEFVMSADGTTFSGSWGYGSNLSGGSWTGSKRITPVAPAPDPNAPENQKKIILRIDHPNISVNGKLVALDSPPTLLNGRTLLPIRAVAEAMGGTVGWDNAERKVTVSAKGTTIEMWLDNTTIKVNGQNKTIDVAPTTINSRTMVPVRFVADNIPGCGISWDGDTQSAVIAY